VTQQLASCAAAEAVDFALIRPGSLAGAAWLLLWLPGGLWLGFAAGKAVADVFWYGAEARGAPWPGPVGPGLTGRARKPGRGTMGG